MRSLFIILFLFLTQASIGQDQSRSMSLALREYLEQADPGEQMHLAVKGDLNAIKEWASGSGSFFRKAAGGYAFITLSAGQVEPLLQTGYVKSYDFSWAKGQVLNDTMRVRNNINPVHLGQGGLPQGYEGEGVVMGYIDGGLAWDHPDFQNPDGSTRVVYVWKQFQTNDPLLTPAKYGYGRMYDSTDINSGAVGIGGQLVDHGTTVTGTGSGNGLANGRHKGAAPKSDIIVVSSNFNAAGWELTVADAVDFIVSYADSMGKPCVINASIGTYVGSHDAKDPAALYIDSLLNDKGGRIMVCAAGNSGNWGPYHLSYPVTSDTAMTWFKVNPSLWTGTPGVFLDIWADTLDMQNVELSVSAEKVNPSYSRRGRTDFFDVSVMLDSTLIDTIMNGTDTLAWVEYTAVKRGGQYNIQVYVKDPDSSQYEFGLLATGTGTFDLWSHTNLDLNEIDTTISGLPGFTDQSLYRYPDSSKIIVSSWTCSPNVITVGNYYGYLTYDSYSGSPVTLPGTVGDITITSSDGPSRTGLIKPDVAGPGDLTMSAATLNTLNTWRNNFPDYVDQGGWHLRNGGTSMASPGVAGIAALYLEHCPQASVADFKQRLLNNTDTDNFTTASPNNTFGYGKVNGLRTLQGTLYSPQILGDTSLCTGDFAVLETQQFYYDWDWSTGDSTGQILLYTGDTVTVVTRDSSWCPGFADSVIVVEYPSPAQPQLTVDADTLYSSPAGSYQWFLNSAMVFGATDSSYVISQSGDYFVQVGNQYGCTTNSDTVYVSGTGLGDEAYLFSLYPNPSDGLFRLRSLEKPLNAEVYDGSGRLVQRLATSTEMTIDLTACERGIYFLFISFNGSQHTLTLLKH